MHELYMRRCFDLARFGVQMTQPNPMVGAVLVHENRIIGEGFHKEHGGPHAEVEAVASVSEEDRPLISKATLYVSLEPCNFHGNTPACTDLILREGIPKVVVSCIDQTAAVSGKGLDLLRQNGVEVITGVLREEGEALSAIRNTFVRLDRPYIILKLARSKDGFMGQAGKQVWLTNSYSKTLVHKWRTEVAAILVGTQTAVIDNPQLNSRRYPGPDPIRIVLDKDQKIPADHHLLNDQQATWIITEQKPDTSKPWKRTIWKNIRFDEQLLPTLCQELASEKLSTLLVEGGPRTLQSFIDLSLWDEARILEAPIFLGDGIQAPVMEGFQEKVYQIGTDALMILKNQELVR